MQSRYKAPRGKDKRHFKRTAVETKKINISPSNMRGGIRL